MDNNNQLEKWLRRLKVWKLGTFRINSNYFAHISLFIGAQSKYDKNMYLNKSKRNILVIVKGNSKRYESIMLWFKCLCFFPFLMVHKMNHAFYNLWSLRFYEIQ